MASLLDLAYFAGVVDSDGCIMISKLSNHGRSRDSVSYCAVVVVQQVEPQAVEAMRAAFGGTLLMINDKRPGTRPMLRFAVKNQRAATFLRAIEPYLRIKAEQARNAIALAELVTSTRAARCIGRGGRLGPRHRNDDETAAMHSRYERGRQLNSGEINPAYHALIAARTQQQGLFVKEQRP